MIKATATIILVQLSATENPELEGKWVDADASWHMSTPDSHAYQSTTQSHMPPLKTAQGQPKYWD